MYLVFYFQGEPYLNPQFLDMVKYASGKKIYTATSTNAHYLNEANAKKTIESGLDRLIISIDGTTQDVYQQYRVGGNLEKVLEGARNVVKWNTAPPPGLGSAQMRPPCDSTMVRQIESPTPMPAGFEVLKG